MEKARDLQYIETWWRIDECAKVVEKKKLLFDVMNESKNREDREKAEADKEAYAQANRNAKKVIGSVKQNRKVKSGANPWKKNTQRGKYSKLWSRW